MQTDKIELKEVVANLRRRAAESQVFNAMMHVFAMRERTRQQIMLPTLYHTMVNEGFKHSREDYAKELKYLSDQGIGKLTLDKKARINGLTKIGVTLQSIGTAALAKVDQLNQLRIHPKFVKLPPAVDFSAAEKKISEFVNSRTKEKLAEHSVFNAPKIVIDPPKPPPKEKPLPPPPTTRMVLKRDDNIVADFDGYRATLVLEKEGVKREIYIANRISAEQILNLIVSLQEKK